MQYNAKSFCQQRSSNIPGNFIKKRYLFTVFSLAVPHFSWPQSDQMKMEKFYAFASTEKSVSSYLRKLIMP